MIWLWIFTSAFILRILIVRHAFHHTLCHFFGRQVFVIYSLGFHLSHHFFCLFLSLRRPFKMPNKFKGFDNYKVCKDNLLSFNYSRLFFHKSGKNSVISINQFWGTFVDTFVFSWTDISVVEIHDTLSKAFFCGFVVNFQKLSELNLKFSIKSCFQNCSWTYISHSLLVQHCFLKGHFLWLFTLLYWNLILKY